VDLNLIDLRASLLGIDQLHSGFKSYDLAAWPVRASEAVLLRRGMDLELEATVTKEWAQLHHPRWCLRVVSRSTRPEN